MAFDMSTLMQPGKVAVLFSEVQRSVIGDAARLPAIAHVAEEVGVIKNSARLAKAARDRGVTIVHCLANLNPDRFGGNSNARLFKGSGNKSADMPAYDPSTDAPCPEVYEEGDVISMRDHGLNPMADNSLDRRLRNEGITTVIVAGVSLNVAIPNLVMDAVNNSYQVIVARDSVSGFPAEYTDHILNNTLAIIATLGTVDDIIAALNTMKG